MSDAPGAGEARPGVTAAGPGALVVGVGARGSATAAELLGLIRRALAEAGPPGTPVALIATLTGKAAHPAVRRAAAALGVPVAEHPADALATVPVPHPSAVVGAAVGTAGVAEAAALASAPGGELVVPKRKSPAATVAVARLPRHPAPPPAPAGDPPMTPASGSTPGPHTPSAAEPSPAGAAEAAKAAKAAEPDLRHHGDAEVRAAGPDLVDLAVNVRTGTPPQWLREHLAATLADLAAYPDGTSAHAAVAARHGRPVDEVLLTSGAAEAFVLLARTLTARHIVVVHPQFTEPEAALRDAGHAVHRVLLSPADGFRLTPDAVPEAADLVVLGNPTNPTSVLHPAAAVAALARPGRTLVIDEAFMDTVPGETESLASSARELPGRVVVLRSLTKTWGLAGLRIGYALGPAPLIAGLAAAQPLWPVSTPALAAAEACSTPAALAEAEEASHELALRRDHLLKGLSALPAVRVHGEPAASFVLIELPGADTVRTALRERGFAVRRGDTFPGLGPDWLRIAVRDEPTTDRFLAALEAALEAVTGR
ncbi:Rv2231c family pyridoxal phosphate-dependent protein CobC [Streptomyces sp. BE303]|uniref:Rv2231c family pyridoxal phosphate-dependent protein CobC n=1 Tax=Streptomyces sp. BE303 TaxID=3002528 RepID=UPI002E795849|nr:Rv2231c family pyridoxal phosphate-dependent protein CobC [Streptomyces sp. BE303]MED7949252.1 Rv2231c family pyridoxal phosphate-dependent protein CobC [Streptomyces sp. BE303]